MKIDQAAAEHLLRDVAASQEAIDPAWREKIEHFSELCEAGVSKTHVAFLGTALLAKAVDGRVDLFAIKPDHARDNPNAYSARTLAHGVLVPLAAELGFSIGVSGREPLNNQPYFRMVRLDDGTPVHQGGRAAFDFMVALVDEVNAGDAKNARRALTAFVAVRKTYLRVYAGGGDVRMITPEALIAAIEALVTENAEGGRRAQAVAAGVFDVFAGVDRVESGRINDPSRKLPGDVNVRLAADSDRVSKAVEVRDKPVSDADVRIFGTKCLAMGVGEAAVLMVAPEQPRLDSASLAAWAAERALGLTLFYGWPAFVDQALFWAEETKQESASRAVAAIHERLVGVEASPKALEIWLRLTGGEIA